LSESSGGGCRRRERLTGCIYYSIYRRMDDADFDDLLDQYLDGTLFPNMEMADVEIVWVEGDTRLGALHIAQHGVSKDEVEQALLETPPDVEAKKHEDHPGRTIFWGA